VEPQARPHVLPQSRSQSLLAPRGARCALSLLDAAGADSCVLLVQMPLSVDALDMTGPFRGVQGCQRATALCLDLRHRLGGALPATERHLPLSDWDARGYAVLPEGEAPGVPLPTLLRVPHACGTLHPGDSDAAAPRCGPAPRTGGGYYYGVALSVADAARVQQQEAANVGSLLYVIPFATLRSNTCVEAVFHRPERLVRSQLPRALPPMTVAPPPSRDSAVADFAVSHQLLQRLLGGDLPSSLRVPRRLLPSGDLLRGLPLLRALVAAPAVGCACAHDAAQWLNWLQSRSGHEPRVAAVPFMLNASSPCGSSTCATRPPVPLAPAYGAPPVLAPPDSRRSVVFVLHDVPPRGSTVSCGAPIGSACADFSVDSAGAVTMHACAYLVPSVHRDVAAVHERVCALLQAAANASTLATRAADATGSSSPPEVLPLHARLTAGMVAVASVAAAHAAVVGSAAWMENVAARDAHEGLCFEDSIAFLELAALVTRTVFDERSVPRVGMRHEVAAPDTHPEASFAAWRAAAAVAGRLALPDTVGVVSDCGTVEAPSAASAVSHAGSKRTRSGGGNGGDGPRALAVSGEGDLLPGPHRRYVMKEQAVASPVAALRSSPAARGQPHMLPVASTGGVEASRPASAETGTDTDSSSLALSRSSRRGRAATAVSRGRDNQPGGAASARSRSRSSRSRSRSRSQSGSSSRGGRSGGGQRAVAGGATGSSTAGLDAAASRQPRMRRHDMRARQRKRARRASHSQSPEVLSVSGSESDARPYERRRRGEEVGGDSEDEEAESAAAWPSREARARERRQEARLHAQILRMSSEDRHGHVRTRDLRAWCHRQQPPIVLPENNSTLRARINRYKKLPLER
jgi:hypothetical protein